MWQTCRQYRWIVSPELTTDFMTEVVAMIILEDCMQLAVSGEGK